MARKRRKGRSLRVWIFFCALLVLFPLLLTAASPDAYRAVPVARTPSAQTPILPRQEAAPVADATDEPSLAPAVVSAEIPTAAPTAPATSGDMFSDVFTDAAAPEPLAAQAAAPETPQTPGETAEPENGLWEYASDSIRVSIERHEKDGFVYFAADLRLSDVSLFSYAFANEKFGAQTEALSDIALRHDPLLAINGDYCGFHNNGVIIRGGELFRKQNSARTLLIVEADGSLSILSDRTEKQGLVAKRLMEQNVRHTFEFGPALVENGEAVRLHSAIVRVDKGYLEPRTAIGQFADDPLHYLVIVVDGRQEGYSKGCDLPALQALFLDYGVQTAFNLDGGGSTTLWFDGQVINRPASGEERKVSDIIMFLREREES